MAAFVCIDAQSNMPAFVRNCGLKGETLACTLITSLNGSRMFAEDKGFELLATDSEHLKVIYRNFTKSLTVLLLTADADALDDHLHRKLQILLDAITLFYGSAELDDIRTIDTFRREIRISYDLLDYVLSLDALPPSAQDCHVLITPHYAALLSRLEQFCTDIGSPYGCLYCRDGRRTVAGTEKWWSLDSTDRTMLLLLADCCLAKAMAVDVPVFLPKGSPTTPHRYVACQLSDSVYLAAICGADPSLSEFIATVEKLWPSFCTEVLSIGAAPAGLVVHRASAQMALSHDLLATPAPQPLLAHSLALLGLALTDAAELAAELTAFLIVNRWKQRSVMLDCGNKEARRSLTEFYEHVRDAEPSEEGLGWGECYWQEASASFYHLRVAFVAADRLRAPQGCAFAAYCRFRAATPRFAWASLAHQLLVRLVSALALHDPHGIFLDGSLKVPATLLRAKSLPA